MVGREKTNGGGGLEITKGLTGIRTSRRGRQSTITKTLFEISRETRILKESGTRIRESVRRIMTSHFGD